jgi:hypothetical protein
MGVRLDFPTIDKKVAGTHIVIACPARRLFTTQQDDPR